MILRPLAAAVRRHADRGARRLTQLEKERPGSKAIGRSPASAEGGLDGEPEADATALARGGPTAADSQEAEEARSIDRSVRRHRAEHPHQVWAVGFQFEATAEGRRLRLLNVIDEHSTQVLSDGLAWFGTVYTGDGNDQTVVQGVCLATEGAGNANRLR